MIQSITIIEQDPTGAVKVGVKLLTTNQHLTKSSLQQSLI